MAQLYRDDLSSDPDLVNGNIAAAVANLHGEFIQELTATIGPRLLSEGTSQHQTLANGLGAYDLGSAPFISEETILLQTIGLSNADRFNEHQSTSQSGVDVPGEPAGSSTAVVALLDQVGAVPGSQVNPQSGQTLLNRARAATCGGCHMTAARSGGGFLAGPGVIVRENADGTVIRWPDVAPSGFVHVSEADRALSPALEEVLLPVRRYIMGRFICQGLEAASIATFEQPVPDLYSPLLAQSDVPAEAVSQGERFLDEVIGLYSQEVERQLGDDAEAAVADRSGMQDMGSSERNALRVRVANVIDAARAIEQQRPGAFVESRRPH